MRLIDSFSTMRLICRPICLGLTCLMLLSSSGCQTGRQWFQMDSNSATPYFGFELMPRKTSLVVPTNSDPQAPHVNGRPIAELTNGRSPSFETNPIILPRLSLIQSSERLEDVSLSGPQSVFSK